MYVVNCFVKILLADQSMIWWLDKKNTRKKIEKKRALPLPVVGNGAAQNTIFNIPEQLEAINKIKLIDTRQYYWRVLTTTAKSRYRIEELKFRKV